MFGQFEGSAADARNGGTDFNAEETTANGDSCAREDSMVKLQIIALQVIN